jgi:hypothetical protein
MSTIGTRDARLAGEAEEEFVRLTQAAHVYVYDDGHGVFSCPLRTVRDAENALRHRASSKFRATIDTTNGLCLLLDTKALRHGTAALLFALTTVAASVTLGWLLHTRIMS